MERTGHDPPRPGRPVIQGDLLRHASIVALCVVVGSVLVSVAQHIERGHLARAEARATVTATHDSPSDLDDLDRILDDIHASTTRWLAVYLPLLTLGTALVVAAGSRHRGAAVVTCVASLTPVVAAAVAVTAPLAGAARALPALYVVVGVVVALLVKGRPTPSQPPP